MRKYLLPTGVILYLGLCYALAQNITKSIQLSQYPGAIGLDASNNVFFPGHINTVGAAPTLGTGLSTASLTGTDVFGTISGVTASNGPGTLTFSKAYLAAPSCVITNGLGTTSSPIGYTIVLTGINFSTYTGALKAYYVCLSTK